jgi:hypothetical protein
MLSLHHHKAERDKNTDMISYLSCSDRITQIHNKIKDKQITYNVRLSLIRVSVVAVENK